MTETILCVDDEPKVLRALQRSLAGEFQLELAEGPEVALEAIAGSGPYSVVLADMRMPGMDGIELLSRIRRCSPDTVRMMLTGNSDLQTAMRAVNEGNIFRFLLKPCPLDHLKEALEAAVAQYRLVRGERELLEGTVDGCIEVLVEILSLVSPGTFEESRAVKSLAGQTARALRMAHPWQVEVGVMLSQLGRVTIPPGILQRSDEGQPLEPGEQALLAQIPTIGGRLIEHIPRLDAVARIVQHQRDDFDPDSYGDRVPLGARILRACFDLHDLEAGGSRRAEALARMLGSDVYDHDVVRALASIGPSSSAGAEACPPVLLEIELRQLRPGHVLAAPVETLDGKCIVREGHRVSQVLIERLHNHHQACGIRQPLFVEDPGRLRRPAGQALGTG